MILEAQNKTSKNTNAARPGFTLVEILVVIIILGLIAAIVIPNLSLLVPTENLKSELRQMASLMALAQNQSVTTGQPYVIVYDFEHQCYYSRNRVIPADESEEDAIDLKFEMGKDIYIKDVLTPAGKFADKFFVVTHYPNGMVDPYIVHLTLKRDEEEDIEMSIKVNPLTGETTIYDGYREWEDELRE